MIDLVYETHSTRAQRGRGGDRLARGASVGGRSARRRARSGATGADDGVDGDLHLRSGPRASRPRIAFEGSAIPVFLDWRLRECNYGELNGSPSQRSTPSRRAGSTSRIRAARAIARWSCASQSFSPTSPMRFDGGRVLLVSHAAPRRALQHLLEERPLEELVSRRSSGKKAGSTGSILGKHPRARLLVWPRRPCSPPASSSRSSPDCRESALSTRSPSRSGRRRSPSGRSSARRSSSRSISPSG